MARLAPLPTPTTSHRIVKKLYNFVKLLLFFAIVAYGQQQERVAIINTVDDADSIKFSDLNYLTIRLREKAINVLPNSRYFVMSMQSIVDFLGSEERAQKECKESSCLADLGRKVNADYVAQARIGRFDNNLSIGVELYNSKNGAMVGSFTGNSKTISGLLTIIDENAPVLFKKIPGVSGSSKASPFLAGGIGGVQIKGADYEFDGDKRYLASIASSPHGASLSFNGMPDAHCTKTPCNVELGEGSVRIIANLEQYEIADTTVSITHNNQSINILLKPNFGILEIKPAYSDGIGSYKQWALSINGKPNSFGEIRLSPNKYSVELSHECYETISFEAGINRDSREIFDMASHLKLKKGGLTLSAERDGEPASEPVYVNGKQVGETPFSGAVPVCAKVEISDGREAIDVKLKHNEKVEHTHSLYAGGGKPFIYASGGRPFTDSRDGKKYKTVKIGERVWMAENLNYNASGKCYDNNSANCDKYGSLYNRYTAKAACPSGWHLPSDGDWNVLMKFVNPSCSDNSNCAGAGIKLKAANGWNNNKGKSGNGTDEFGFSALPGGYGLSYGDFKGVGDYGKWWSASGNAIRMSYNDGDIGWLNYIMSDLLSVRCVLD